MSSVSQKLVAACPMSPLHAAAKLPSAINVAPTVESKPVRLRDLFVKALKVDGMSAKTIEAYCDAVKLLADFLHRSPLKDITVNEIRAFFFTCLKSVNMPLAPTIWPSMD